MREYRTEAAAGRGSSIEYADMLLLRFGEFTLKGKNRNRFEKTVLRHVKEMVKPYPKAVLSKEFGRIYVTLNGEPASELAEALRNVFGIASISPVKVSRSEFDDILAASRRFLEIIAPPQGTTFKVNARRVWKEFPHGSIEMNKLISTPLLQGYPGLLVDVKSPELELKLEIREGSTYIFCDQIEGVGGFPLGTNGKAMLLLSGGIDSPVAAWSSMRRGLEVECVHFYSYPYTSELARQKVVDLARVLSRYAGVIKLHLVPFTEVQTSFTGIGQDNLIITLMRRAMLRITTRLAEREGALAVVTGDSLGQVASQTLSSMNVIGRATALPLLRPLVMMDKSEIVELSQRIGTYELSILPYEDCCTLFVPKSPTTNPNLRIIEKIEATLPGYSARLDEAVAGTETITITPYGEEKPQDLVPAQSGLQEEWF
ncbi:MULTISPECIES: tRNA uracil 4-sulfurtransferase ThiI [unclassified Paenibacillus]|uniref:tRNA uracil 4-sulfurtransferase ThiI n=1 Tax=unclassified Paenibacillus TaxID=185978 RepID=UPI0024049C04|nr:MULTISPECIES: tRNA uracil 4-sulfurtransferase ThiI [unclassified Paenibacillus]MDF9843245.1 thiamine biosynthesis protein ThiI [Paenibacillus sp. PastF-2]MDF9849833.1 thiamine biosynthesis protein ThiI [Paenibacillus sp. PastM-2]MDF9856540.1 thiamine biosynthesis protein ThiI [Paenibacillus sp. PastF-1]MDH6481810.1 thiamine biosynthesis protein ThiI [Paenibacillus sp. PastH-2]MDH6509101.1 thiamine biosynthesis protein ThiI [Paenibacillus sp. PastM-3]